jgi:hypothetical protein
MCVVDIVLPAYFSNSCVNFFARVRVVRTSLLADEMSCRNRYDLYSWSNACPADAGAELARMRVMKNG